MAIRVRHDVSPTQLGRLAYRTGKGLAAREDRQRQEDREYDISKTKYGALRRQMEQQADIDARRDYQKVSEQGAMDRQKYGAEQAILQDERTSQRQEQMYTEWMPESQRQIGEIQAQQAEADAKTAIERNRLRADDWAMRYQKIMAEDGLDLRAKEQAVVALNAKYPDLPESVLEYGMKRAGHLPEPEPPPYMDMQDPSQPLPSGWIRLPDGGVAQMNGEGEYKAVGKGPADAEKPAMTQNEILGMSLKIAQALAPPVKTATGTEVNPDLEKTLLHVREQIERSLRSPEEVEAAYQESVRAQVEKMYRMAHGVPPTQHTQNYLARKVGVGGAEPEAPQTEEAKIEQLKELARQGSVSVQQALDKMGVEWR
ncbi:MAG TPA: hypothetical protein VM537_22740 [Anaerolineae bacterium]|nr:hypothetical protein [Anaerolineae bacterium]